MIFFNLAGVMLWTIGITQTNCPIPVRIMFIVAGLFYMGIAIWKEQKLENRIDELAIALEQTKNKNQLK